MGTMKLVRLGVPLCAVSSCCMAIALGEPGHAQNAGVGDSTASLAAEQGAGASPLARDDGASTDEGLVVDIAVLSNDRDPDGDALRVLSVTQGANGSVLINGDDTLRYQPHTGFAGLDGFAYTITDPGGERATAAVRVSVRPATGP